MKKLIKRVIILLVALLVVGLIISIISVNVKYNKYLNITDLDMTEQYITDWGYVSIDRVRIFKQDEFIKDYPDTQMYISKSNISNDVGYMVIYATFDVTDMDKYDTEWFKMWSIEVNNGWGSGKDMLLNNCMNDNVKITENGRYEMCCVYDIRLDIMSLSTFDEVYNLKYKVMINQNPIVYYKLDITE